MRSGHFSVSISVSSETQGIQGEPWFVFTLLVNPKKESVADVKRRIGNQLIWPTEYIVLDLQEHFPLEGGLDNTRLLQDVGIDQNDGRPTNRPTIYCSLYKVNP